MEGKSTNVVVLEPNVAAGEQILTVELTPAQQKALAEIVPQFADRLPASGKKPKAARFSADELAGIEPAVRAAWLRAESRPARNLLRRLFTIVCQAAGRSDAFESIPVAKHVYQFKITLLGTDPPIWRRIQVHDCTFDGLNVHIQDAMGWMGEHLFAFNIAGMRYTQHEGWASDSDDWDFSEEEFAENEPDAQEQSEDAQLSEVLPDDGERFCFEYEYDFGDSWKHEIAFEGILSAEPGRVYPVCLEGQLACPPEDIGGVWGYYDMLATIADPKNKRNKEITEWLGDPFDPEAFDPAETSKIMQGGHFVGNSRHPISW